MRKPPVASIARVADVGLQRPGADLPQEADALEHRAGQEHEARRDAAALRTPLFLTQAADASHPPMPVDMAAKLSIHASQGHQDGLVHA